MCHVPNICQISTTTQSFFDITMTMAEDRCSLNFSALLYYCLMFKSRNFEKKDTEISPEMSVLCQQCPKLLPNSNHEVHARISFVFLPHKEQRANSWQCLHGSKSAKHKNHNQSKKTYCHCKRQAVTSFLSSSTC